MKRIALIALITAGACGWLAARALAMAQRKAPAPAVVFSVTPLKSTYMEGQAMELQLQLTNNGPATLIVDANFAMGASVHPSLTDPKGQPVDWEKAFRPGIPDFETLAPGNSLTQIVCLNCGIREPFNTPFQMTGQYAGHLVYRLAGVSAQVANFPGAVPMRQTLTTAAFHFQISPPMVLFTARPTQPVFQAGQPITFTFQLQNKTNLAVLAAYDLALNDAVQLKIVDANGNPVDWTGAQNPATPMLSTVAPGTSIDSTYPITPTNLFGTVVAGANIREPGTYTAYAAYGIPESFNVLRAYVGILPMLIVPGPLNAPPVKFTVAPAASPSSTQ
jgi:hypothetical protein